MPKGHFLIAYLDVFDFSMTCSCDVLVSRKLQKYQSLAQGCAGSSSADKSNQEFKSCRIIFLGGPWLRSSAVWQPVVVEAQAIPVQAAVQGLEILVALLLQALAIILISSQPRSEGLQTLAVFKYLAILRKRTRVLLK
ncbi:hypothetical protein [Curvibacter gracilis]|uniref:hypothetical protein n=1 Tax=Curvibacter gracilis TaxID=230310 RepID=UPI0012F7251F|nr:hypothetical protein [Curvibacter gracilis]